MNFIFEINHYLLSGKKFSRYSGAKDTWAFTFFLQQKNAVIA